MCKRKAQMMICVLLFVELIVLLHLQTVIIVWEDYDVNLRVASLMYDEDASAYLGKKKILLWTTFFEDDWFHMGEDGHFDHCPVYKNCFLTRSRDLVSIWNFNAILFHANEMNRSDLPRSRSLRQKYVFVNLESPKNWPLADLYLEDFFNLTMTYRLDSDIPWPYYVMRNIDSREPVAPLRSVEWREPSYEHLSWNWHLKFDKKKKTAAWLVSNCHTRGRRELFVEKLEHYIQVDQIGKCAQSAVPPECMKSVDSCFAEIIEPEYFFYFSFENTLCQDYVTEKFFNALSYNIIPVVYGGANYSLFAPPHSYIDALDFESPEALAIFLMELTHNREEYSKYFWWKRFYTVESPRNWTLCKICEELNVPKPPKTYSPLSGWFVEGKCPIQDPLNGTEHATKNLRTRILEPLRKEH